MKDAEYNNEGAEYNSPLSILGNNYIYGPWS